MAETVALGNREILQGAHGEFLPGTRPGPGRPRKGQTYWDRLNKLVDEHPDEVAAAMFRKLLTGDVRAHEYYSDRTIGKPADKLIHADASDPGTQLLMAMFQQWQAQLGQPMDQGAIVTDSAIVSEPQEQSQA
jgi:hypothetical protein